MNPSAPASSVIIEPPPIVADDQRVNLLARKVLARTFIATLIAHAVADMFGQSIWPVYKKLAGLDLRVAGVIATIVGMSGTAMQPLFGLWADRIGRRTFILTGTMLTMLAALLGPLTGLWPVIDAHVPAMFGLAASYVVMFVILLAGRIGQDMFHPAGAGVAGSYSSMRGSTFTAIFVAIGSVGYGISQIAFSATFLHLHGHTEILLIPAIALLVPIWAWCRPAPAHPAGHHETLRQSLASLRPVARPIIVLFLILAMSAGVLSGLYFLAPEFIASRGYPVWLGDGGAFGLIILGATVMMVPMGHLADRVGRRWMLIVMLILSAVSYHLIVRLPAMPVWAFCVLCVVGGAFMGTVNPLGVALGQRLAHRNMSTVSSLLMGLPWCLSYTVPGIVGYMAKLHGPQTTLYWLSGVNVLMVAAGFLLPGEKAERRE